jgi:hypothetical protein
MPSKKKRPHRILSPQERLARTLAAGAPIPRSPKDPTPEYTGVLAKPLPHILTGEPPFDGRLPAFRDFEHIDLHLNNEITRRLFLLLDHHGISRESKSRWIMLAQALARTHVPGFRFEKDEKRGVKMQWKYRRELAFYAAVKLRVLDGLSVAEACRQLAGTKEYRPMKAGSLRTRFQRIKRENPSARDWDTCPPEDYPEFKKHLSAVLK